jgi:hypothetical protein
VMGTISLVDLSSVSRRRACTAIRAQSHENSRYRWNTRRLHYHEARTTGMSSKCVSIL